MKCYAKRHALAAKQRSSGKKISAWSIHTEVRLVKMKSAIIYSATLAFIVVMVSITGDFMWGWWILLAFIYNALL